MDDFEFFLKLAKPLALNLPDARDRTMAALWLKKLCDVSSRESETEPDDIPVEFLKLLLFVMQGGHLTGIFEKAPPQGSLHDILQSGQRKAADMIPLVKRRRTVAESRSISRGHPRVVTSIGGDMCEYVAVQEIPNFGIHGYYALSTEPLPKWWNPRSSTVSEAHASSPPLLKNTAGTYDSDRAEESNSTKDLETENFEEAADKMGNDSTIVVERAEASLRNKEFSKDTHEKTRQSEKYLRKIFQAQRSEIAGVETRPSWGRNRYIDRLVDESPHLVGDLDLSEADALLHLYRDRRLMKINKNERSGAKDSACAISSRRRQVEARLDMPPCASVPVEEDTDTDTESRTCLPKKSDSNCMDDVRSGNYDRCCLSENEEYYPTEPIESVGSVSLRGGSDDTGLASRSGCCQGRRDRRDGPRRNQPTPNALRKGDRNNNKSYPGRHEGLDVDREIAEATGLASGTIPFDVDKAGNFAWVKKDRCRFVKDHRKMTSKNFVANADRRDRSERYDDAPDSRLGCNQRAERDYGRDADRYASGSGVQPAQATSQKTILRSKAARPEAPGVNEKTRYWSEILDFEDTMENPTMPESYGMSCCGCRDRQNGSEMSMDTPAHNWRDFAYESEDEENNEERTIMEEQRSRTPRAMMSDDSNTLREEVRCLLTDPERTAPPSMGRVKAPRKKRPTVVDQRNVEHERWDPSGHSTTIEH